LKRLKIFAGKITAVFAIKNTVFLRAFFEIAVSAMQAQRSRPASKTPNFFFCGFHHPRNSFKFGFILIFRRYKNSARFAK
jgi:hypothetical protein